MRLARIGTAMPSLPGMPCGRRKGRYCTRFAACGHDDKHIREVGLCKFFVGRVLVTRQLRDVYLIVQQISLALAEKASYATRCEPTHEEQNR